MPIKNKTFLWKRNTVEFWRITRRNTTFWQNHGIHGIWRKSRFPWFPCFRDYLLSLMRSNTYARRLCWWIWRQRRTVPLPGPPPTTGSYPWRYACMVLVYSAGCGCHHWRIAHKTWSQPNGRSKCCSDATDDSEQRWHWDDHLPTLYMYVYTTIHASSP